MARTRTHLVTPRSCLGTLALLVVAVPVALWLVYLRNNAPPNVAIPTPVMPANNAYNDFLRAAQMAGTIKHKAPASMNNPPTTRAAYLAECKACTEEMQPALAAMRRGLDKPCMRPPERSAVPSITGFASFRELEREITGVEQYYEMTGRPADAVNAALDGTEVGVMLPNGSDLMADLVGFACEAISLNQIGPLLPKLDEAELARVAIRLDRIAAKRAAYADIVLEDGRSETAMMRDGLRDPKAATLTARYDALRSMFGVQDGKRPTFKQAWAMARFTMANKGAMLRDNLAYYDAVAKECRRPFTGKSSATPPDNPFSSLLGDMVAVQGRQLHLAHQSVTDLLRLEVGIYRYKAARGRYPERLEELAPAYVATLPCDPFAQGKPYIYHAQNGGSGFLLYGVGPDMTDNGGRPARNPAAPPGDIVAGRLFHPHPLPTK